MSCNVVDDPPVASTTNTLTNPDPQLRLDELTSQATIQYSKKKYDEAAELYAHATELQARINGEMSPRNADLLYAYGRCLYQVAVKKSDVLGSKVASEKKEDIASSKKPASQPARNEESLSSGPHVSLSSATGTTTLESSSSDTRMDSKPYFHFTGDENFDTSDEEEGDVDADAGEEEEDDDEETDEDDFAIAYEVLDLARILLMQNIEDGKGGHTNSQGPDSPLLRQSRERLADTYDLQAEISLEGERFEDAVLDLRSALQWKTQLFPFESNFLAEAHYKLSLALEFSSVTQPRDSKGELEDGKPVAVNEQKRADAIKEMQLAIASCKARISAEETKHRSTVGSHNGVGSKDDNRAIEDVEDMVREMEQRVNPIMTQLDTCQADEV